MIKSIVSLNIINDR